MNKFLEKQYLPKLTEEAVSLNRPLIAGEIEAVTKKQKPWARRFHRRILQNN